MKALGVGVEDFFGEAWLYVYTRLNWVERINDVEVANYTSATAGLST